MTHRLTPDDKFLVLASDGLFQDLSSDEVIQLIGEYLTDPSKRPPQSTLCSYLLQHALLRASQYAFQGELSEEERVSLVLQLPATHKRRYHDDISIVVVCFDDTLSPIVLRSSL